MPDKYINPAAQAQFRKIFEEAQARIVDMIVNYRELGLPGYEIGRQRILLKQVDEILQQTDQPVISWIEDWLPESYSKGTLYATRSLKNLGVASESDLRAGFSVVDREQVRVLAESMAVAVDGMQAQILSKFDQAIRASQLDAAADLAATQEVAVGTVQGAGIEGIRKKLLENVLSGKMAPGGYKGSISSYAELLARTRVAEAQNLAALRRIENFGLDLVKVIGDGESCPLCAPWDNMVFSISGSSRKFPSLATVGPPPWHPNCDHRIIPWVEELASDEEMGAAVRLAASVVKAA